MYKIEFNSNYLSHHGILGQKWGQRNGPPYPLSASDHSAREKKAGYTKSIKKSSAKKDDRSSQSYASKVGKTGINTYSKIEEKYSAKIRDAYNSGDFDKLDALYNDYETEIGEMYQGFFDAGYDFVARGAGSDDKLSLHFGYSLDDPIVDKQGNEYWVKVFLIDNKDLKIKDITKDW